jgi:hypothetical protein
VKQLSGQENEDGEAAKKKSGTLDEEHKDTHPLRLEAGLGLAGRNEEPSPTLVNNMAPPLEKDFGALVISEAGTSRYVSHNFWAQVMEEVYIRVLVPYPEPC